MLLSHETVDGTEWKWSVWKHSETTLAGGQRRKDRSARPVDLPPVAALYLMAQSGILAAIDRTPTYVAESALLSTSL